MFGLGLGLGIKAGIPIEIGAAPAPPEPPTEAFTFDIDTTEGNGSTTVNLPHRGGQEVFWGDGTSSFDYSHTYDNPGVYEIKIAGSVNDFSYKNNTTDREKITNIKSWYNFTFTGQGHFQNCDNLTVTAIDIPTINTSTMIATFSGCHVLTEVPSINSWDFGICSNMNNFFNTCNIFNQSEVSINAPALTQASGFFRNCYQFNGTIDFPNSPNLDNISRMFRSATIFNNRLLFMERPNNVGNLVELFYQCPNYNDPYISNWHTSTVYSTYRTFRQCTSFNQPLTNWDTSIMDNMNSMFYGCSSLDQDISNFNFAAAESLALFLYNVPLSVANYDALLQQLDLTVTRTNLNMTANLCQFTNGSLAQVARDNLQIVWLMTITDSGGV